MTNEQHAPQPPRARRTPTTRTFHNDVFVDPYEWMRDKESPQLQRFVEEENAYTDTRMAHLEPLRERLFDEFKSRVQETDMSVPTRMDGYWYYVRTQEGLQYGTQCRLPIRGADDWDPPVIDAAQAPGELAGEQVVFDANVEAQGHEFFTLGGMDISKDGRWMLFGVDTRGDERYDFSIRDLDTGEELPERFDGIAAACFTPDARYVFYTVLDDAQRPYLIRRHKVGAPVESDVDVYEESDERFWTGVGMSFDDRHIVIGTGSKTTSEVLMLPVDDPEGEFTPVIPRREGIEYDVSFGVFEHAGEQGEDIPIAVVYHNAVNPNFEIDVIDMRAHKPPYRLGDGVTIAVGSPYGTELGDRVAPGARRTPVGTPFTDARNPALLQGVRGLAIEGIAFHKNFVALSYRGDGLPRLAITTKGQAARDFLAGRPWSFTELVPPPLEGDNDPADVPALRGFEGTAGRMYSIGTAGNPSYEAPRMRYSFTSYTRPGELREIDPATGEDTLLKAATVLGGYDARAYAERSIWVRARDGESIPVSLVYKKGAARVDADVHHRVRRVRDQHRPRVLGGAREYARPRRALCRAACARRRRDGARMVRNGPAAQQKTHVRGFRGRHGCAAGLRARGSGAHGGERRVRRRPADGRGGESGAGTLCRHRGGRAVRGRADDDARPEPAAHRDRMGRMGGPAARCGGVPLHARVFAV